MTEPMTKINSKINPSVKSKTMKNMTKIVNLIGFALVLLALSGLKEMKAQIPAAPQSEPIVLTGGTIHTVTNGMIENGTIVFENGVITAIGTDVSYPEGAVVKDVSGKHIFPGLIDAYSQMGIYEIGAVNMTVDVNEQGTVNPNVKVERAFNPESRHIGIARSAGILVSVTSPGGGLISGQSAAMLMDGWSWDAMTLKSGVGLIVNWPNASSDNYQENIQSLKEVFADARAYHKARKAVVAGGVSRHDIDTRWESMIPVFDGEMPLVVNANEVRQIQDAVTWAEEEGLKMILLGGRDADLVADHLLEKDISVIITSVIDSPNRDWQAYDESYSLPARLHEAGITFAIAGIANPANANRLPLEAGAAAAFGLPVHEAMRALTINPATILGLENRVGSLEVGKDASLLITDGLPIEYATQVEQVYIRGSESDMMDMHRQFYHKYKEKVDQAGR